MSEPGQNRRTVRYFCTAGSGMEPFLVTELKLKLSAEQVRQLPGKVLFSSSADINTVTELKSAERLFLLLRLDSPVQLSAHMKPAKAASVLQSRLLGDRSQWSEAAETWRRLQGELADQPRITKTPITSISVPTSVPGETGRTEGGRGREEVQREEKWSGDDQTLERKRKRDDEENTETAERKRKTDYREDDEHGGGREATLRQPSRAKLDDSVSFRISCKCTGALSRYFSSQEVSRVMGSGLRRLLGWTVDLKNPQLEVNVNLSDDHCLLGFPLTRLPLANRSYMKTTGLRSTVAWAMTSLAHIQPGSCVLDPMCGAGTVLIEAAQEHQTVCFVGVDIDDGQLQRANQNVEFAKLEDRIHLLKASSMTLPLPSSSVDAVVCDLPFGRKFGTKTNVAADLPAILREMERVLCVGGVLVLLLSPQLSCVLKKLLTSKPETKPQTGTPDRQIHQEVKPNPTPGPDPQPGPEPSLSPPDSDPQPGPEPSLIPPDSDPQPGPEPSLSPPDSDPQPGLEPGPPPPLWSLEHRETLRVSLGAIDGLIHKYVKIHT